MTGGFSSGEEEESLDEGAEELGSEDELSLLSESLEEGVLDGLLVSEEVSPELVSEDSGRVLAGVEATPSSGVQETRQNTISKAVAIANILFISLIPLQAQYSEQVLQNRSPIHSTRDRIDLSLFLQL